MKRILFVDDDPDILRGLKRRLRSKRAQWEMEFVASGQAGLEAIDRQPFHVVVSDLQMPGMNGAVFLAEVQARHPETVRIVLSGQTDLEGSLRSVPVSHQYLSQPCDAEVLQEVIDRACGLESLLRDPALKKLLGNVQDLPALPRVYQALTRALADTEIELPEVGSIVAQDPALATKILKLVNSSYFGLGKAIIDLPQAATYLGASTLRNLVLSFEVFSRIDVSVPGFSVEAEQAHAMLVARIAKRLLEDRSERDMAFMAALLHDLGKLVLVTRMPKHLCAILAEAGSGERPMFEIEEKLIGASHAELGAYLLGLWGMPYPIVEAVAHHHHPSRVRGQRAFGVLGAVHAADVLAHERSGPGAGPPLDHAYLQEIGVAGELDRWQGIADEEAEIAYGGEADAA